MELGISEHMIKIETSAVFFFERKFNFGMTSTHEIFERLNLNV